MTRNEAEAIKWIGSIVGERQTQLLLGHKEQYFWGWFYWETWMEFDQVLSKNVPAQGFVIEEIGGVGQRLKDWDRALEVLETVNRAHAIKLATRALGIKD